MGERTLEASSRHAGALRGSMEFLAEGAFLAAAHMCSYAAILRALPAGADIPGDDCVPVEPGHDDHIHWPRDGSHPEGRLYALLQRVVCAQPFDRARADGLVAAVEEAALLRQHDVGRIEDAPGEGEEQAAWRAMSMSSLHAACGTPEAERFLEEMQT